MKNKLSVLFGLIVMISSVSLFAWDDCPSCGDGDEVMNMEECEDGSCDDTEIDVD
jgi:hypothetical protein